MRIFLFIFLAFVFVVPLHGAVAADVFIKKKNQDKSAQEDLEDALNLGNKPKAPPTDTLGSADLNEKYFRFCMSKDDPVMSDFSQEMLCGCTAAKMQETMSSEDMRALFTDTKEGAFQRSRVMAFIYVPCMRYPVRDLLYGECTGNENIKKSLRNYNKVCTCLADNMSEFVTGQGAAILSNTDRRGIADPEALVNNTLADFMNSKAYAAKSSYYTTRCIQKHEFGW